MMYSSYSGSINGDFTGLIFLLIPIVIILTIHVMFILSQNKLIDELEEKLQDEELVISKAWTWTELIPVWGIIATYMSLSKIEENTSIYRMRELTY